METYLQSKLEWFSKKKRVAILEEYDRRKLNTGSAWALWLFWFHYLHLNKVGIWLLFVVSCFIYGVWFMWWLIQAFMLVDNVNKKNKEILESCINRNVDMK